MYLICIHDYMIIYMKNCVYIYIEKLCIYIYISKQNDGVSNKIATKIQPLIELLDMGLKLRVRWKSWQCLLSGLLRLVAARF